MKRLCLALLMMLPSMAALAAGEGATQAASDQQETSPWLPLPEGEPILTMQDVPLDLMYQDPDKYLGKVFEDRFKFFHIFHQEIIKKNPDYHDYRQLTDSIPGWSDS